VVASADAAKKAAAALALAAALQFGVADLAEAKTVQPYAGLTPCAANKAFEKREKGEIKGLTKRLKMVRHPLATAAPASAAVVPKQTARERGVPWARVDAELSHQSGCADTRTHALSARCVVEAVGAAQALLFLVLLVHNCPITQLPASLRPRWEASHAVSIQLRVYSYTPRRSRTRDEAPVRWFAAPEHC